MDYIKPKILSTISTLESIARGNKDSEQIYGVVDTLREVLRAVDAERKKNETMYNG